MIEESQEQELKKRGRKVGSHLAKKPAGRPANRYKPRTTIVERGMTDGSVVKFNITQQLATARYGNSANVENIYKIGRMISAKNSSSGRLECTLHTASGALIGFVLVQYLELEST